MSDLTGIINQHAPGQVVEAWYAARQVPRLRLGLSEVGHECPRYLWYRHHGYPSAPIDGRILRLFRLGELIEEHAVIDLMSAGYQIHSRQKEVSFEYETLRLTGHIDGIIEGLIESQKPHLFECKSSSAKRFADLKKKGYEAWDEKYKAQVHVYMLSLKLTRCLVWVENKDTSEVYTERIHLDRPFAINTMQIAFEAISRASAPERACPRADWYKAKWCGYYEVCFNFSCPSNARNPT